jgi:Xaa-Pro aminopeptidase
VVPEFKSRSEGIDVINQARFTKDLDEIAAIRKMGLTVTEVVRRVENFIKNDCRIKGNLLVGKDGEEITVGDIKRKINLWLSELGGENPEGTIFSVGKDSAVPHNSGDDGQTIETGKTIVFDFFPCEMGGGYFYDFTRTWCIGKASDHLVNAY